MAMHFSIYEGSGRATCKLCGKIIQKGQMQITASTSMGVASSTGSIHAKIEDCPAFRRQLKPYVDVAPYNHDMPEDYSVK